MIKITGVWLCFMDHWGSLELILRSITFCSQNLCEIEGAVDGMLISMHSPTLLNPNYDCSKVSSTSDSLQILWPSYVRVAIWCLPPGKIRSVSDGKEWCVCWRVFIKWCQVSSLWFRKCVTSHQRACIGVENALTASILCLVHHVNQTSCHWTTQSAQESSQI